MTPGPALLLAAAAAASDAPSRALPKDARFSGPMLCRFPKDGPLKRAVLLSLDDAEGREKIVLRGIDGRGVVVDERVLTLTREESRPVVSRRKRPAPPPERWAFAASGTPPVFGTLEVEFEARKAVVMAARTEEPTLLGGACEATLTLEKPK
ncbi:MAG: hypothetical protein M0D55_00150 [Elusimicrobiota bacterium]|nr:MAG: hypothetical protein M0D55_00150 [Elusimicrobiota bacterium]